MSKKMKIGIAAAAAGAVLLAVLLVLVLRKDKPNEVPGVPSGSQIVGTWYSDKPDSVTFTEDGHYKFAPWNGGNPWLSFAGTYTVKENSVILQSDQDGKTELAITVLDDQTTLVGKYTYYNNVEDAKAAYEKKLQDEQTMQENIVPDTVATLVGEWISNDGMTSCSITETGMTVSFKGNDAVPAESLFYEYKILNGQTIEIRKNGSSATYPYTLKEQNGNLTFFCTGIDYAPSYIKVREGGEMAPETNPTQPEKTDTVTIIQSEKNPDKSNFTDELNSAVQEILIGTWKGTFEEWPTEDSSYWTYTFTQDGQYTFSDGTHTESGSYKLTSDPNDNYYNSQLDLSADGQSRTLKIYLTTGDPLKMITDDQTDPTFIKE